MTAVRHIERRASRLPNPVNAVVRLTRSEFDALPTYSISLPTGTTIGKRWKRGEPFRDCHVPPEGRTWWLGEYYDCGVPGQVGMRWSRIEVVE